MKPIKGQGIIIEIMIFGVAIFLSIMIFILLTAGEVERNQEIELEADMELSGPTAISSTDSILHMPIQNTPEIDTDYNGKTFYKLLSFYYSTNEDPVIDGEEYSRDDLGEDLQAYLEYEAEHRWENDDGTSGHSVSRHQGGNVGAGGVSQIGESDDPKPYDIRIEYNGDRINATRGGQGRTITVVRPIPLSSGENAYLEATIAR